MFAVAPLILALPSGQAVDRYGERRAMLVGAALVVVAAAAFVLVGGGVAGLVTANVLLGTGHLCAVVGQQALVANATPARHDSAFGFYTFATSVGQALGPGLILLFGGTRPIPETGTIFLTALGLAVVLLGVTLPLRSSDRVRTTASAGADDRMGSLLRRPGLLRAMLVSCVVLAAVDITLVYLPALCTERGIAAGAIGTLLALRAGASMVSRLFLGRLSRRLGRRPLLSSRRVPASHSPAPHRQCWSRRCPGTRGVSPVALSSTLTWRPGCRWVAVDSRSRLGGRGPDRSVQVG